MLARLAFLGTDEEHVALLVKSRSFRLFRRKDDLLAQGVAAVFGLAEGEAELLALCFHAQTFTPTEAANWLVERSFTPLLFIPILSVRPCFSDTVLRMERRNGKNGIRSTL